MPQSENTKRSKKTSTNRMILDMKLLGMVINQKNKKLSSQHHYLKSHN